MSLNEHDCILLLSQSSALLGEPLERMMARHRELFAYPDGQIREVAETMAREEYNRIRGMMASLDRRARLEYSRSRIAVH